MGRQNSKDLFKFPLPAVRPVAYFKPFSFHKLINEEGLEVLQILN